MSQSDIEVIEERIASLEHQARLWRRGGTATMTLLGVLLVLSFVGGPERARATGTDARELVVRKITVVDEQGRPGIVLEVDKRGAVLRLVGEHGKSSLGLEVGNGGSVGIGLIDKHGIPEAGLSIQKDGPELMLFNNKKMSPAAFLTVSRDGARLYLKGEHEGAPSTTLEVNRIGSSLGLSDGNGHERAYLHVVPVGPALEFRDQDGKLRANFGVVEGEAARNGVTESTGPGSITLYGKDGKVTWKAP